MAGGKERELRRRIKSVRSTRKITKAMELIAASQIARAQSRIAANRPYRLGMQRLILEAVAGDREAAKKLLAVPERLENVVVLVIVGDRGLSGAYNTSVLRAAEHEIARLKGSGSNVRVVAVGKKALSYLRFRGIDVAHSFAGISDKPTYADARDVASAVSDGFVHLEVDQVLLVSMRFVSGARQVVETRQLLPLPEPDAAVVDATEQELLRGYTEFEPDVERLLPELAPAAVESEVFTALLEGAASFHTSQQRAMAAATDNADELARLLTREVNRARQDSITTEIMEIVGGAEALRQEKEHA
jgi:F-type H+-transporting ATPase subunit gamma